MKHNNVQKAVAYTAFTFCIKNSLLKLIQRHYFTTVNYYFQNEIVAGLKDKSIDVDEQVLATYLLFNFKPRSKEETLLRQLWKEKDLLVIQDKIKKLNQFLTLIELPIIKVDLIDLSGYLESIEPGR